MSKHTPGNWYAMIHETGGIIDQATVLSDHETDGEPTFLADTMSIDDEVPLEQRRANALLFAASKNLLAAAIKTVEENRNLADGDDCTLRHLLAAIAEAEGRPFPSTQVTNQGE